MAGAAAAATGAAAAATGAAAEPSVFGAPEYSAVRTPVALFIWIGAIHFNAALILVALLLPSRLGVGVFGVMLFFTLLPLNDKNPWGQQLARFLCKYCCGYFPMTLHVEDIADFNPNEAYVFGFEPHSVIPMGVCALSNFWGLMPLPKIKVLASSAIFHTPFLRQIWTWTGLVPATKKNFYSYLAAGYSCIVVPGGVQEMMHMGHDSEVAFLKRRKGFVRIAIEMGRPLVPVFCFGQGKAYKWWRPGGKLVARISRAIKFTPIIFWGKYGTPLPYQHPMHIVVGRPIVVKKNPQPSPEEVDEIHDQFVAALQALFEKYRGRVGHPNLLLSVL